MFSITLVSENGVSATKLAFENSKNQKK